MVSPFLSSQLALSFIRQRVAASVPSDLQDRVSQFRDWVRLNSMTGEPRAMLSSLWNALRRPHPEAQKELARAHSEVLFSDPSFSEHFFKDHINGFDAYSKDKDGILRMIGERGFEGYIGLLVSVMNQHWSHVWMVENYRVKRGLHLDDEELELHNESVRIIVQFLALIGKSPLIQRHFEVSWLAKVAHGHNLEVVHSTVNEALRRAHLSANFTLGASPQSLSRP